METTNTDDEQRADFHAILTPHRSLERRGFIILMSVLLGTWLVTGLFFLSMGAWPIFGFFGFDMLAIWIAFRVSYRSARAREEVRLTRDALHIAKITANGKRTEIVFNPFWTKFKIARHPYIGVTDMVLLSRRKMVRVGDFLNPEDKASFASAFQLALAKTRAR